MFFWWQNVCKLIRIDSSCTLCLVLTPKYWQKRDKREHFVLRCFYSILPNKNCLRNYLNYLYKCCYCDIFLTHSCCRSRACFDRSSWYVLMILPQYLDIFMQNMRIPVEVVYMYVVYYEKIADASKISNLQCCIWQIKWFHWRFSKMCTLLVSLQHNNPWNTLFWYYCDVS